MLSHERKMTQIHLKVRKNLELSLEEEIVSKKEIELHLGFRKILVSPLYSRLFQVD